jgi:hypothetical protein
MHSGAQPRFLRSSCVPPSEIPKEPDTPHAKACLLLRRIRRWCSLMAHLARGLKADKSRARSAFFNYNLGAVPHLRIWNGMAPAFSAPHPALSHAGEKGVRKDHWALPRRRTITSSTEQSCGGDKNVKSFSRGPSILPVRDESRLRDGVFAVGVGL